jgi:hypothetical protein
MRAAGTCLYEYLPILRVHDKAEDSQPYMSAGCRSGRYCAGRETEQVVESTAL